MAHTASTGSAKRTVDVAGKRLGIKRFGGQFVNAGEIILRQRGSEFYPGVDTKQGKDFTIYSAKEGIVSFRRMTGYKRNQKYVDILPRPMAANAELKVEKKAVKAAATKAVTSMPVKAEAATTKKPAAKKAKAVEAK